jgi:hypothetical protein
VASGSPNVRDERQAKPVRSSDLLGFRRVKESACNTQPLAYSGDMKTNDTSYTEWFAVLVHEYANACHDSLRLTNSGENEAIRYYREGKTPKQACDILRRHDQEPIPAGK